MYMFIKTNTFVNGSILNVGLVVLSFVSIVVIFQGEGEGADHLLPSGTTHGL